MITDGFPSNTSVRTLIDNPEDRIMTFYTCAPGTKRPIDDVRADLRFLNSQLTHLLIAMIGSEKEDPRLQVVKDNIEELKRAYPKWEYRPRLKTL